LESPKAHRAYKSPEKARKSAMLPGFQNSFINSPPVRPSQAHSGQGGEFSNENGKVKEIETYFTSQYPSPINPPCSPTRVNQCPEDVDITMDDAATGSRDEDRVIEADLSRTNLRGVGDVEMMNEGDGSALEEFDQVETPDWKQEVYSVLA
jgi:hypothetical protein